MSDNLDRMRKVKIALYATTADGFSVPWPKGVHSAVKFSTEMLEADVEEGGYGVLTHPRQATELLRLNTVAHRQRAEAEAHTRGNLQGGLHSGNLRWAVNDLLDMIAKNHEGMEMWAESAARRHRESENALRVATGQRVILYPPEMRRS